MEFEVNGFIGSIKCKITSNSKEEEIKRVFNYGNCHSLALAINKLTGWPLYGRCMACTAPQTWKMACRATSLSKTRKVDSSILRDSDRKKSLSKIGTLQNSSLLTRGIYARGFAAGIKQASDTGRPASKTLYHSHRKFWRAYQYKSPSTFLFLTFGGGRGTL